MITTDFGTDTILKFGSGGIYETRPTYRSLAEAMGAASQNSFLPEKLKEQLAVPAGIKHHLEVVSTIGNITFIDDSKATNVNATWHSLETLPGSIVLIMGGVDKGNNYDVLHPLIKKKVSAIVCLGSDTKNITGSLSDLVTTVTADPLHMGAAVQEAYRFALADTSTNTVLLSPACASFDLFKNYQDRGDQFKDAVHKLCA